MPNDVLLAPSILAADYAVLADQVALVRAESDWVHVDLMDGHFVPNLSIGPPVVASLRKHTDLVLDCHLMVTDPGFWLEPLAEAGANLCSVHVELGDPAPLLARTRELGMQAGVVIDGPTPFEAAEPYLDDRIDLVLVMTIKAGFGGQPFVPEHLDKVRKARELRDARGLGFRIEVDGGIKVETAAAAVEAGADVLVSGTGIFQQPDPAVAARQIRRVAGAVTR
ncbi:MAG TPA: ribulose-phosphate 3-epimerase [Actinomycetota bacterium]|nr:ribulose-phosphate 3-epimerase [Actinomycetota bacterium]